MMDEESQERPVVSVWDLMHAVWDCVALTVMELLVRSLRFETRRILFEALRPKEGMFDNTTTVQNGLSEKMRLEIVRMNKAGDN